MRLVCYVYCLSGFVSLGYQVAWFRIYVDRFGSTNLTFALVLCNFIAGLGVGSLISRRVATCLSKWFGIGDGLRCYGLVEILVAASVLLTLAFGLIPAGAWGHFPYTLQGNIYQPTTLYQFSKWGIAAGTIFVPCLFMGVTFPLLCNVFREDGRFPSKLYAWNTLGACSGVLACQFFLLQYFGHDRMLLVLAGANALFGAYFLLTGAADTGDKPARSYSDSDGPGGTADDESRETARGSQSELGAGTGVSVLIACAVLSGFLSGALEADMFRRVRFLGGYSNSAMSFVSFWAILAIFVGSSIIRKLASMQLKHIKIAYTAAFLCYFATWKSLSMFDETNMVRLLSFSGLVVFPSYLLTSLLLPYVCNRLQDRHRHLGLAYGLNTLAFCVGMISFTWGAPQVSIFYSLKLFMSVLAICVVLLWLMFEGRRLAIWKPLAAVAALGFACLVTPMGFDKTFFGAGHVARHHPVRSMKSSSSYTTFIVEDPSGDRLFFETYSMSAVNRDAKVYMRLMAHFPLLCHPNPQSALLICYGCGNTASAIAAHDTIEQIDVVDLNDKVIETAPEFAPLTRDVHLDSRLRFIHDDGRNFLNVTENKYDLITSEPPPPMYSGVYRLYSKEYYEQVFEHLTDNGMMTQWLPAGQMPPEAVDMAVSTFISVFPDTLLFTGQGKQFILLGSKAPIQMSRCKEQFGRIPTVLKDLQYLQIPSYISLATRVVKGDATLRREFADKRVISDQHNDFAELFANTDNAATISYNPLAVIKDFRDQPEAFDEEIVSIIKHMGRLRFHVPRFPQVSLMTVPSFHLNGVKLANVDWNRSHSFYRAAREVMRDRDIAAAIAYLQRSLALADEQPRMNLELSSLYIAAGRYEESISQLRAVLAVEPRALDGEILVVRERARGGRPPDWELLNTAGLVMRLRGEIDTAIAQYRRAIELKPDFAEAYNNLGRVLQMIGEHEEAAANFQKSLDIKPGLSEPAENLKRKAGA